LISGLPKLLEFFQAKADQAHERDLARISAERDLQMAAQGFAAQQRIEELRSEQVAMQTEAQMTQAALDHDKKVLEKASKWVANYVGTVRPTVTYIFILELVAINAAITYYAFTDPNLIRSMDDFLKVSTVIFSEEEMSMLGGILGFWFGSRSWSKK
jgi:multidrug efflux pump subunit AcrA (membrane-fusion protein)